MQAQKPGADPRKSIQVPSTHPTRFRSVSPLSKKARVKEELLMM